VEVSEQVLASDIGALQVVRQVRDDRLDDDALTLLRLEALASAREGARRPLRQLWLRWGVAPYLFVSDAVAGGVTFVAGTASIGLCLALGIITLALLTHHGAYRPRLNASALDLLPKLIASPLLAAAIVAVWSGITGPDMTHARETMLAGLLFAGLLCVERPLCAVVVKRARKSRTVAHRTLVIGAGQVGRQITLRLLETAEFGLFPVAVWDVDPLYVSDEFGGVPLIRNMTNLAELISVAGAKVVIIAFSGHSESEMVGIVQTCDRMDCEIFVIPRLFELHQHDADMEELWGIPLARLRRPAFRSPTWRLKRLLDIAVATLLFVPLAPIFAMVALAVRLEGGPGIIFRQKRVGLDGRTFDLMKFRSMRPVNEAESQTNWNVAHDARVGPVGKFIRRTAIDELPQLWNILRGDMTLVGPRPERPFYVEKFAEQFPRYLARNRVPAGLTGWAQIHGLRGDTSIADRVTFDNYYIQNWSLWLDVRILLRTVLSVLRREGS
jgi:exopolysaccharide biosynthesis polyprenyl glycosylphosphotransferase